MVRSPGGAAGGGAFGGCSRCRDGRTVETGTVATVRAGASARTRSPPDAPASTSWVPGPKPTSSTLPPQQAVVVTRVSPGGFTFGAQQPWPASIIAQSSAHGIAQTVAVEIASTPRNASNATQRVVMGREVMAPDNSSAGTRKVKTAHALRHEPPLAIVLEGLAMEPIRPWVETWL